MVTLDGTFLRLGSANRAARWSLEERNPSGATVAMPYIEEAKFVGQISQVYHRGRKGGRKVNGK